MMAKKSKNTKTKKSTSPRSTTKRRETSRPDKEPTKNDGATPKKDGDDVIVVGIGASAGGLEAFREFLTALPDDTGLAYVLVQHLKPEQTSLTAELLSKHTSMQVAQVADEPQIQPNRVYVIPPNTDLTLEGDHLALHAPSREHGARATVDVFFRSLASARREKAIGVVLSGSGSDGSLGLKEIKAQGGMTIAQDPAEAQHDSMPRSAVATGAVDFVLPIKEMPARILRYAQHPYVNGTSIIPAAPPSAKPDQSLQEILAILRTQTKYDFRHYKKSMLERRIRRRMGLNHVESFEKYVENLRATPHEAKELFRDMLIGVTGFFRQPEAFADLEEKVIPRIVQGGDADRPIRAWVPGCATGEEAYSIAIVMVERLSATNSTRPVQVFASDIDEEALEIARNATYPETIAADVTPERLRKFFVQETHAYRISAEVRDTVVVARQNVLSDPPFSKLDLITCRNLLIYLDHEIQEKVFSLFHFALNNGGFLFLGESETIGPHTDRFEPVSKKWRIYRRTASARPRAFELPAPPRMAPAYGELSYTKARNACRTSVELPNRPFCTSGHRRPY